MSAGIRTTMRLCAAAVLAPAILAGCSKAGSPTAPTDEGITTGAVIAGIAVGGGGGSAAGLGTHASGSSVTGLTVTIAGTNRSTGVDQNGRFELTDVPPGDISLQFRNDTVNATAPLGGVSSEQHIEIRVEVSGTSALITEEVRTEKVTLCHVDELGDYHRIDVSVNAEPAHRAHGDGAPGETLPGNDELIFDSLCRLIGPSIRIEKSTNGEDSDTAPGEEIPAGTPLLWEYVVTNDGSLPLTGIAVVDDQGVVVSCPATTLAPGASMTCTATGVVTLEEPYANLGTATANWSSSTGSGSVNDSDPSHYTGISPLEIEKTTNGEDADSAPGPSILVGDPVVWEYTLTNIGVVPLSDIVVSDDQGVAVSCPATTLAAGASMTCTGNGVATLGQYSNLGTATATWTAPTASGTTTVSDPSHYIGVEELEGLKVSLCHRTGAGFYVLINVSINAEPAHLAHGDGKPGEAVPGGGGTFTATCGVS